MSAYFNLMFSQSISRKSAGSNSAIAKSRLVMVAAIIAIVGACQQEITNSHPAEIITDLGNSEAAYYYKIDGDQIQRGSCAQGTLPSYCTSLHEGVDLGAFRFSLESFDASISPAQYANFYALLESPVAFRPLRNNDSLASYRSIIGNMNEAFAFLQDKRIDRVETGPDHSCAITKNTAKIYCWGANEFGQLGTGDKLTRSVPSAIQVNPSFKILALKSGFSCGLTNSGKAYCWGQNNRGQLGSGDFENKSIPTAVKGNLQFTSLSAGEQYVCGIAKNGRLYCWGSNDMGQLGVGDQKDRKEPTAIASTEVYAVVAAKISHTCAITANSAMTFCWGANDRGQLGNGNSTVKSSSIPLKAQLAVSLQTLALGAQSTFGLTADGLAYSWGSNQSGILGVSTVGDVLVPEMINGNLEFNSLEVATDHVCATEKSYNSNGTASKVTKAVYCWGSNDKGQLGIGVPGDKSEPTLVVRGEDLQSIAVRDGGSCALTHAGKLVCWGENSLGLLADGSDQSQIGPVAAATQMKFATLMLSNRLGCAASINGVAYCWGENKNGSLGIGADSNKIKNMPAPAYFVPGPALK